VYRAGDVYLAKDGEVRGVGIIDHQDAPHAGRRKEPPRRGGAGDVGEVIVDEGGAGLVGVAAIGGAAVVEEHVVQHGPGGVAHVDGQHRAELEVQEASEVVDAAGRHQDGGASNEKVGQEDVIDRRVADQRRVKRVRQRVDQKVEASAVHKDGRADKEI